jgi:uncharacterized membrane protein
MLPYLALFFALFTPYLVIPGMLMILYGIGACSDPKNGNGGVIVFIVGVVLCVLGFNF